MVKVSMRQRRRREVSHRSQLVMQMVSLDRWRRKRSVRRGHKMMMLTIWRHQNLKTVRIDLLSGA